MLVLRSDISRKLKSVSLLLINIKIFTDNSDDFEYGEIWNNKADIIKSNIESAGVRIIGYRSDNKVSAKAANRLGIKNMILNGNRKKELLSKLDGVYSFKDILIMGDELNDIELARLSRFSVATATSSLELKMESNYVSNFSGINAYQEIGNLILNAKGPY